MRENDRGGECNQEGVIVSTYVNVTMNPLIQLVYTNESILKKQIITNAGIDVGQRDPHTLLVGM
jgi:hypothetical protein